MKKAGILLVLSLAYFSVGAQQNSIKLNPIGIIGGSALGSYEMALGKTTSLSIGMNYLNYKVDGDDYKSIGGEIQYRFYFKELLKGLYLAPVVSFSDGKHTTASKDKIKFTALGAGGVFGYQWIWESGFTLDVNVGMDYRNFNYKGAKDLSMDLESDMISAIFGIGIGYSF